MTTYQLLLKYYLSSSKYFLDLVDWFYEAYEHIGKCGAGENDFYTDVYCVLKKKENFDGGFNLNLTDKQIQLYFNTNFSEMQLFAIIYAYWAGFSAPQIKQIASRKKYKYTWEILNYFICNPIAEILPTKLELSQYRYSGKHYIKIGNTLNEATRTENRLIAEGLGEEFII